MKDRMVEELGRNIEDKKTMSKEYEGKVNKRIFSNILIAIVTLLYLIILILGSTNIDKDIFIVDLKVCSIILSLASILIFERSYKTSDGKLCVHGVETLILAIITLAAVYIFQTMNEIFTHIICGVAVAIPIYYLIKSVGIYNKSKREYINDQSDIKEIVRDDLPETVETKRRRQMMEEQMEEYNNNLFKENTRWQQREEIQNKPKDYDDDFNLSFEDVDEQEDDDDFDLDFGDDEIDNKKEASNDDDLDLDEEYSSDKKDKDEEEDDYFDLNFDDDDDDYEDKNNDDDDDDDYEDKNNDDDDEYVERRKTSTTIKRKTVSEPEQLSILDDEDEEPKPTPKKRGRKPKAQVAEVEDTITEVEDIQEEKPAPKKRGRKPKNQVQTENVLDEINEPEPQEEKPAPKKRGRKPKNQI